MSLCKLSPSPLPLGCQWLVQTYEQYKTPPPEISSSTMIVPLPPLVGIDVEANTTTSGAVIGSGSNDTAMIVDQSTTCITTLSTPLPPPLLATTNGEEDATIVPIEKRPRLN